jgi:hypothetical protein
MPMMNNNSMSGRADIFIMSWELSSYCLRGVVSN